MLGRLHVPSPLNTQGASLSPSEYGELVEFLGRRFDQIDRRFDAVEVRLGRLEERMERLEVRVGRLEDRVLSVEVGQESLHDLIKLNAEAILSLDQKVDRFRVEANARFDRLDYRVDRLEVA